MYFLFDKFYRKKSIDIKDARNKKKIRQNKKINTDFSCPKSEIMWFYSMWKKIDGLKKLTAPLKVAW